MIPRSLVYTILALILIFPSKPFANPDDSGILKLEDGFYYIVKKGDTLWDVSAKFFNTPWYWPGLWSENDVAISSQNPHWIYPGQKLRLALREEAPLPLLPPAIPEPKPVAIVEATPPPPPSFTFSPIHKVGFITPQPADPSGHLLSATEAKEMISSGDRVYIQPAQGRLLPIAGRYIVYGKPERVQDPDHRRKSAGFLHHISGIIEITEYRNDLTIGNVTHAFRPMQARDGLFPIPQRNPQIPMRPPVSGLEGKIIAGDLGQVMFAEGDLLYINLGEKDGVLPGQEYHLIEEKEINPTGAKKDIRKDRIPFGAIFILDVREQASAAVVIDSRKDARLGTLVVSPQR
jgi:hypothetical protein